MANLLDLAAAQLTGFAHGKWNSSDIIGLITAMNLRKKEWVKLRNDCSLDDEDKEEIDEYFGIK